MKKNFRKLQLFLAISKIDIDMFYSIEVTEYSIKLQGRYTTEAARMFKNWTCEIVDNGYIYFTKSNVRIVLSN
jgi:hypothetical protein